MIPVLLPITVIKKTFHLIILFFVWLILSSVLEQYIGLEKIFFTLSVTAIFYRDIYKLIVESTLFLLISFSGGLFLCWLCKGYISSAPFRQECLIKIEVEPVIAALVPSLKKSYRAEYDEIMRLYLESNKLDNEKLLISSISNYWHDNKARTEC